jgi:hypothetical protein
MLQRVVRAAVTAVALPLFLYANVPTPKDHFGYEPGADFKLAKYDEIISYFQRLAETSHRIRLTEYGKTAYGRTSYVAYISSEENLSRLDELKANNRKLALGVATPAEARELAGAGKAFVWIDSGLHATETAPAQHSTELAWRMVTGEDAETRRIRENVILVQVPVINPDGLDMVVDWYRKNLGTPYELAPLPALYQRYAGHDNNRDFFMMNLAETRNTARLLFHEVLPQIVYNQHQAPAFPARIFVPPYAEPLNPHIPAAVMEGINLIGSAMKERFARENKPGVLSYFGFDAWWNGGLRSSPAFHNMHGILTETALHGYGTPRVYKMSDLPERFGNGMPTKQASVFYERPWLGGRWGTREAIEYMLTADMAILDLAASRREHLLMKAWELARESIEAGKRGTPYAYVVPLEDTDQGNAHEMLWRLQLGGLEIKRATSPFKAGGSEYPAGTFVLPAAQPFRPYLLDLMEPQKYPEIRSGSSGPTKRPYDIAGWTLPMLMGVRTIRVDEPFQAALEPASRVERLAPNFDRSETNSFIAVAGALERGEAVRWGSDGTILRAADSGFNSGAWELRKPRLALYQPWSPNMDAGWTEWVLDQYKVPYEIVRNADIRAGGLRDKFDSIILASQPLDSLLHGFKEGEPSTRRATQQPHGESPTLQRPEHTGGIGLEGAAALERFVREGGTLIALDGATQLPIQLFGLPLRSTISTGAGGTSGYFCPGSILRINVEKKHPLAFGMRQSALAFQSGGDAWEITLDPAYNTGSREVRSVARYAAQDVLASGWLSGEHQVANRIILAEARHGDGRVVLFGFRPQFRGQTFGTFKLLLNAIYRGSARELGNSK